MTGMVYFSLSPLAASLDDVRTIHPLKVDVPLELDGILNEPFWQDAEIATDFIRKRTGIVSENISTARIAYTSTYLYIGVECFDEYMDQIHATERREDRQFTGDDWFEVQFDTFHDHRAKYAFYSNPLGTRLDARASVGPGSYNSGWSAEWECAAHIFDNRWTFEMRIPFSAMNYERGDNRTWGVQFSRTYRRTNDESFWNFSATDSYDPRHFGHLVGLDLADSYFDRDWEISPYVSSTMDLGSEGDSSAPTGMDLSFRLTPAIKTAWAINPDFGQVEADSDTIELRDTERFLPERRPFFREGEELFAMSQSLYYSRRFTDIDTAAKISGKTHNINFNLLNVQGDTTHEEATRHGNSSVFRAVQEFGERSALGYFISDSEFEDGHSRVGQLDGNLYLNDDVYFRFQGAVADDRFDSDDPELQKNRTDQLGYSSMIYEKYPWYASLSYKAITEGFNPTLGFIQRQNIYGPSTYIMYYKSLDHPWIKSLFANLEGALYENDDGRTTLRDYEIEQEIVFTNDFGISMGWEDNFHDPYDNTRSNIGFSLWDSNSFQRFGCTWGHGEFEEIAYDEFILSKGLKFTERMPIKYTFTTRFEEDPYGKEKTVWLNQIVFDYYFTDTMWLKTSLQNKSSDLHNISIIYGWDIFKNTKWYMVYNNVSNEDDPDTNQSIFTKVVYTFN